MSESIELAEIAVIFTGGTFAMENDPAGGTPVPTVNLAGFLSKLDDVELAGRFTSVEWSNRPSSFFSPAELFELAQEIKATLARSSVYGAVVLHGTDTMEESAYMTELVADPIKPVIFTGGLKRNDEPGYDGLRNFINSARVCLSPDAVNKGTMISMSDYLYAAREVVKVDPFALCFESPGMGPIGCVIGPNVRFRRTPNRQPRFAVTRIEPNVDLIKVVAGSDDLYLRASLNRGVAGIVIEAFGIGSIPPSMLPTIRSAISDGIAIVVASRCHGAETLPIYGFEGGSRYMHDMGAILAGRMPGQRARIHLMSALSVTRGVDQLRELFRIK